jgi:hypothetical protein
MTTTIAPQDTSANPPVFVNWDYVNNRWKNGVGYCIEDPQADYAAVLKEISTKRHPLVEELIATVNKMWKDVGASAACTGCFSGDFDNTKYTYGRSMKDVGCCDTCQYLTPNGCAAKPVACALWTCSLAQLRHLGTYRGTFVNHLSSIFTHLKQNADWLNGYRRGAYRTELQHTKLNTYEIKGLEAAIIEVKALTRRTKIYIKRNKIQFHQSEPKVTLVHINTGTNASA